MRAGLTRAGGREQHGLRMKAKAESIDAYLATLPGAKRRTLEKLRKTIRSIVPAAEECISYRMPAFRYKGALVAYAAFKKHCSFFPMQSSLLDAMKDELKAYRTAKGTLQFALDKPLPVPLIKKMVKARVKENKAREVR